MTAYPKRLIEVDLPIRRISAHARREKSIRHGHISTLHIWWARRPLAACRAVICAALWPDPADEGCPQAFRDAAAMALCDFAEKVRTDAKLAGLCHDSWTRWLRTTPASLRGKNPACWPDMRYALLDFIADFANWDASTVPAFLKTARILTQAAHEALGGAPGTRPLVVDPFAGGGSIPLEALRVGADAFASDLNPVAVLLNKVVLEYIPKYGNAEIPMRNAEGQEVVFHGLAEAVRYWGGWIKRQAEAELAEFYPKDPDGATPIAYLWARTITCEGPGCGAEVPLMRSLWLAKKGERSVALRLIPDDQRKRVDFEIIQRQGGKWETANGKPLDGTPQFDGTVRRGSATCPVCGYTTPVVSVRRQLKARRGGAADARLFCVVMKRSGEQGRFYRPPTERDLEDVRKAMKELVRRKAAHSGPLSLVPDEMLDIRGIRHTWAMIYGLESWGDVFTPRQALALVSLASQIGMLGNRFTHLPLHEAGLTAAVQTCLAMAVDRQADYGSSLCRWVGAGEFIGNTFGRQALPMMWDFCEVVPASDSTGGFSGAYSWVVNVLEREKTSLAEPAQVQRSTATAQPLPDDSANALVTDPPYYDAVPYSYISDFFYVWLRRSLGQAHPELFEAAAVPKDPEIVVDRPHELSNSTHNIAYYERELTKAFAEGRRVLAPDGIGTIVFASKTTASWEAILQAVVDAGWIITGSWPIDTEMEARVAAQGQARLASSVHLVCRPREDASGAIVLDTIGDWRDVLAELPGRIHDWMPRLASEGVVGADAIFACLGPALEIFSRFSRVEKASGEPVTLREYLEHVWAAVSREALALIFEGADTSEFEEDARLTAMWLWTLSTATDDGRTTMDDEGDSEDTGDDSQSAIRNRQSATYSLEYDAARKIAQGLGAHLERLPSIAEVKGETARLLTVAERTRYLFGREEAQTPASRRARPQQLGLFAALDDAEEGGGSWGEKSVPRVGATVLDRIHQAMILFAAGRSEALKRFLVAEGAGKDARFWRLAQALSALYPAGSDEKRWVDGVLARKKGLGL
jgi:putative DNA methylase